MPGKQANLAVIEKESILPTKSPQLLIGFFYTDSMAEHDANLGRVRGKNEAQNEVVDPLVPHENLESGGLPSDRYPRWAHILQVTRDQFSALLEKPEWDRAKLSDPQTFFDFSAKLLRARSQEFAIREDQFKDIVKHLYNELFAYGALGLYLEDPEVEDILLNNYKWMDVVRRGVKYPIIPSPFQSEEEVKQFLQTVIFSPINKEFNRSNPSENAIMGDGSRLFAFTQPISDFTGFAVRKHKKEIFADPQDYMNTEIAPREFFSDLNEWVHGERNLIVSGATGSGKTTFINYAAALIPQDQRIITLEDTPELQIQHPRVLSLHTYEKGARAGSADEKDIPMRDLLRHSLRLKPDRIIVGEVRDAETFDMLDVLNTGHAGSFTTLHSNSPTDALTRLQTMAIRAAVDFPLDALQDLIASVIDIVIQIKNLDGDRRVIAVEQVLYRHHYTDIEQLPGVRKIYNNVFMNTLWAATPGDKNSLHQVNAFLPPNHG